MSTATFQDFGRPFCRDEIRQKRGRFLQKTLTLLAHGEARKSGPCIFCNEPSGRYRSHFPTCENDTALCRECRCAMDFLASFLSGFLASGPVERANSIRSTRYHRLLRALRSLASSMPAVFKESADELAVVDIFGDLEAQNRVVKQAVLRCGCPDLTYEIERIGSLGL